MAEINEMQMNSFASKGTATTALGFGIGSLAYSLLAGGGNGLNLFGNRTDYVSKETFEKESEVSALNSRIAILESEKTADKKIIDTYTAITERVRALENKVADNAGTQAVINSQFNSAISVLQSQVGVLTAMTKTVIPITNVCPQPAVATNPSVSN